MSEQEPIRCPHRTERHRRKRSQIKAWRFSRYINPKYHFRKLMEDIKSAKAGLKLWQLDKANNESELRSALRGKLFATFLAGAPVAGLGPWVGYVYQVSSGQAFAGVVLGVALANIFGLLAFQFIWATTNKAFYERRYGGFVDRWRAMLHDLWPMQWKSVQIAVVMNLLMLPLAKGVVMLFEFAFPAALRYIPIPLLVSFTEAVVIQSTTIRLLGDLFERHSRVMARQYAPSLSPSE